MKPEQERVAALLTDTVTLLCKNGLHFNKGLKVQGLLGITIDDEDVFIVQLNERLGDSKAGEVVDTGNIERTTGVSSSSHETSPVNSPRMATTIEKHGKPSQSERNTIKHKRAADRDSKGYTSSPSKRLATESAVLMPDVKIKQEADYDDDEEDDVVYIDSKDHIMPTSQHSGPFITGVMSNVQGVQDPGGGGGLQQTAPHLPDNYNDDSHSMEGPSSAWPELGDDTAANSSASQTWDIADFLLSGHQASVSQAATLPYSYTSTSTAAVGWSPSNASSNKWLNIQTRRTSKKSQRYRWMCGYEDCTRIYTNQQNLLQHQRSVHGKKLGEPGKYKRLELE